MKMSVNVKNGKSRNPSNFGGFGMRRDNTIDTIQFFMVDLLRWVQKWVQSPNMPDFWAILNEPI